MVGTALMIAVIGNDDIDHSGDSMPWNIQTLDNGATRVFDITLGKTNIQDAHQILSHFSETRLVSIQDRLELHAHFDEFNLDGLLAEIDLIYDIPDAELGKIQQQAIATEQGDYQLIDEQLLMALLTTPVKQIIYKPAIDYDDDIISQRFGEAEHREKISDSVEKLDFPSLGLVIYLNSNGAEQFVYSHITTAKPAEN